MIENFDIQRLIAISRSYGQQSADQALTNLDAWQQQHFWKSKPIKDLENPQGQPEQEQLAS